MTVTDDELRQYYDQHQAEYQLPERVTAQHILFKTQGKTPEEIEAISEKARGVLDRAKKGEDFAALAKQFSEDTSASNGGDLGSFAPGQMVPEFEHVAFSLGAGRHQRSRPDAVRHSHHQGERERSGARRVRSRNSKKRSVRSSRSDKAEQKAAEVAQQIAVELVNNKDLNAVAQKYGAEVERNSADEAGQPIPELGNAAEFERRMFTMTKGEIGTAIQVERGYVIPQLTEISAAHPASFEEAQTQGSDRRRSREGAAAGDRKGQSDSGTAQDPERICRRSPRPSAAKSRPAN